MTMRNGVAGFFTAEALAAGKGIVQTALDTQPLPGKRPADWRDLVPHRRPIAIDASRSTRCARGDLAAAFGPDVRRPAAAPARDAARRDAAAGRPRAAARPGRRAVRPRASSAPSPTSTRTTGS